MMKNSFLDKGVYSHPQIGGYLSVKQFMVVEESGKRCLLLRFINESEHQINAVEFLLKQLDSNGKEIGNVRIKYSDLAIDPDRMYVASNGIVIDDACVDFVVQMISLVSENYKYKFHNGQVTIHYDNRGYADKREVLRDKSYGVSKADVKRKTASSVWCYRLIALLSIVSVIVTMVYLLDVAEYEKIETPIIEQETESTSI